MSLLRSIKAAWIFKIFIAAAFAVTSIFVSISCKSGKETIGIIQFGTHASLNNCYAGIVEGLKDSGTDLDKYDIQYLNSNFQPDVSLSQARKLVNSKAKVIVAIATPSAIQAMTAASGTEVPVVYCAVTDSSQVGGFDNCTGTSDIPDFDAQMKIVHGFLKGRSGLRIGVLMSTEESSDQMQLEALKAAASKYSAIVKDRSVADIATIGTQTRALISSGVDCIVNLLDNTVVGKLDEILSIANEAGIPVFGSEIEQVRAGCLASASIDYITVGRLAGEQAALILKGSKAGDIPARTMEKQTKPYYNSNVLKGFDPSKVALPGSISGLSDVMESK